MDQQLQERVARMFMPYASAQLDRVRDRGTRFVQYTTAEAALSILSQKEVWMRNASCMNDHSEGHHGLRKVLEAYRSPTGERFQAALNDVHEGLTVELANNFDALTPSMLSHTYLACFSEHADDEDDHGRLSMWRAYGGSNGVAIVMNNHPFITPSNALNAWTSPVAYIRESEFVEQLETVTVELRNNRDLLRQFQRENLVEGVRRMLAFAAVSMKHIGFQEEREWRVIYLPHLASSARLIEDHVAIRGVPQPIFKIPMKNFPEEGFTGAEPAELINRIIIGPTQFPIAIRSSLLARLYELKVPDADAKVVVSGIPLRC